MPATRLAAMKLTLLFSATLTIMAGATIAPSLPQMSRVFAGTPNAEFLSKLVLTIPALLIGICAPMAGAIIDRFGRKRLLIFGMALYAVAGTSGLYLSSLPAILVGRAFLGIAVAATMTTIMTLVADYFIGAERNRYMGLQNAFMGSGGMVYIMAGGLLADVHWRAPFAVYAVSLLLIVPAVLTLYEPSRTGEGQPLTAVDEGPVPRGLTVFIYLLAFFIMVIFYMVPVQIPFLLEEMGETRNARTGYAIASMTLTGGLVAINYQRMRARFDFKAIYAMGFILIGAGYLIISQADVYSQVVLGLMVNGSGLGVMMPNTSLWLLAVTPLRVRGRLIGGLTTFFFLGQFFSPIVVAPLVGVWQLPTVFAIAGTAMLLSALGFWVAIAVARGRGAV